MWEEDQPFYKMRQRFYKAVELFLKRKEVKQ